MLRILADCGFAGEVVKVHRFLPHLSHDICDRAGIGAISLDGRQ